MKKILLIDIDNTIYPKSAGLQEELVRRAKIYIKKEIQPSTNHIEKFTKRLVNKYGSIMRGLIVEYKINAEDFIQFVFDIDVGIYLEPNPSLSSVLNGIALKKIAFSNSPEDYVTKVLDTVGVLDCFSDIYGSRFINYSSKCDPAVYEKVLRALDVAPTDCILIDDRRDYLLKAKELGISTILIDEGITSSIQGFDVVIPNILKIADIDFY